MLDKILVICTSRHRPHNVLKVFNSWKQCSSLEHSHFLLGINKEDLTYDHFKSTVSYNLSEAKYFGPASNEHAMRFVDHYRWIMLINDDNEFRSKRWDYQVKAMFGEEQSRLMIYLNDKMVTPKLAGHMIFDSRIIKALGYIYLPSVGHLYGDQAWMDIGNALKCMYYVPELILENMHYTIGKSTYDSVYDHSMHKGDEAAYHNWCKHNRDADIRRVIAHLKGQNNDQHRDSSQSDQTLSNT